MYIRTYIHKNVNIYIYLYTNKTYITLYMHMPLLWPGFIRSQPKTVRRSSSKRRPSTFACLFHLFLASPKTLVCVHPSDRMPPHFESIHMSAHKVFCEYMCGILSDRMPPHFLKVTICQPTRSYVCICV